MLGSALLTAYLHTTRNDLDICYRCLNIENSSIRLQFLYSFEFTRRFVATACAALLRRHEARAHGLSQSPSSHVQRAFIDPGLTFLYLPGRFICHSNPFKMPLEINYDLTAAAQTATKLNNVTYTPLLPTSIKIREVQPIT